MRENLDLKFKHVNPTINIVFTSNLNEAADNVTKYIRCIDLGIMGNQRVRAFGSEVSREVRLMQERRRK